MDQILFEPTEPDCDTIRISVIGVGGCGGNTVNLLADHNLPAHVSTMAMNTDAKALQQSRVETLQLGRELTRGLGAGAEAETGRSAAEESEQDIRTRLQGADLCFITAGMGGGTGTGAAPVVARLAREMNIMTVAIVTRPFGFEGKKRANMAELGLETLAEHTDALLVLPNDYLLRVLGARTPLLKAFSESSKVIQNAVRGLADIIGQTGLINIDFADVRTIMSQQGKAVMGIGLASGENKVEEATLQALNNPLLEKVELERARGVLLNVVASMDIGLDDFQKIGDRVAESVGEEATVVSGITLDPDLTDSIQVTMIATGIQPPKETIAPVHTHHQPEQQGEQPLQEGLDIPAFLRQRQQ
ncbi:cell division protein FtsZ [Oceanimonas baumannii]|uniref:Cell division protein FtsZ n=1 Tax=Oceanimonas baumannii TaxID=129578 RepID=A0A235CGA5_9GAMM|nr:cell division protein FtsZ [Oceanimonas baumannii]OYD23641.1 cell division protein FtsZ [Oceanimonas baumannii]TDW55833.1 cell division protein FtsZ [Oceanimonas baumannii]